MQGRAQQVVKLLEQIDGSTPELKKVISEMANALRCYKGDEMSPEIAEKLKQMLAEMPTVYNKCSKQQEVQIFMEVAKQLRALSRECNTAVKPQENTTSDSQKEPRAVTTHTYNVADMQAFEKSIAHILTATRSENDSDMQMFAQRLRNIELVQKEQNAINQRLIKQIGELQLENQQLRAQIEQCTNDSEAQFQAIANMLDSITLESEFMATRFEELLNEFEQIRAIFRYESTTEGGAQLDQAKPLEASKVNSNDAVLDIGQLVSLQSEEKQEQAPDTQKNILNLVGSMGPAQNDVTAAAHELHNAEPSIITFLTAMCRYDNAQRVMLNAALITSYNTDVEALANAAWGHDVLRLINGTFTERTRYAAYCLHQVADRSVAFILLACLSANEIQMTEGHYHAAYHTELLSGVGDCPALDLLRQVLTGHKGAGASGDKCDVPAISTPEDITKEYLAEAWTVLDPLQYEELVEAIKAKAHFDMADAIERQFGLDMLALHYRALNPCLCMAYSLHRVLDAKDTEALGYITILFSEAYRNDAINSMYTYLYDKCVTADLDWLEPTYGTFIRTMWDV